MVTRNTRYVGAGLLLVVVFAVAAAVLSAGMYTTLPVGLPAFAAAALVAPATLYGFYWVMASLVERNGSAAAE